MDHSVCNLKAILAVAVLAMAAFAGVMIVGDDADATEPATPTYKVTFKYGESMIVDQTSTDVEGQFTFKKTPVEIGFAAPTGYEFNETKWKDASSGAIYNIDSTGNTKYTFSADVTVEPIVDVANDKAVIILTDGVASEKFILSTPYTMEADTEGLADCLKALGLKIDGTNIVVDKTGFRFDGFFTTGTVTGIKTVAGLEGDEGAEVTYTAKFTPVYDISFVVENVTIATIDSDSIKVEDKYIAIPKAPVKDNYLFLGWETKAGALFFSYSEAANVKYAPIDPEFAFTEDTVLYAKFVPVTFTVTFVYGEEKAVFTTETVKYGDLAIEPKGLPEGYKGWDWNFGTKIIADTEIVAIVADPVTVYTVTFEIDGKAPVTQRSDSMVLPDTKIEGKVFQGWVVKGESQYVSPMSYDITEDITFVAVYKEADPPAGPGFFETTTGQCVAVIIAVVIIALIYAVATNMFGLKDALTSVKITRVKK